MKKNIRNLGFKFWVLLFPHFYKKFSNNILLLGFDTLPQVELEYNLNKTHKIPTDLFKGLNSKYSIF
jgi:hypothetical protein